MSANNPLCFLMDPEQTLHCPSTQPIKISLVVGGGGTRPTYAALRYHCCEAVGGPDSGAGEVTFTTYCTAAFERRDNLHGGVGLLYPWKIYDVLQTYQLMSAVTMADAHCTCYSQSDIDRIPCSLLALSPFSPILQSPFISRDANSNLIEHSDLSIEIQLPPPPPRTCYPGLAGGRAEMSRGR